MSSDNWYDRMTWQRAGNVLNVQYTYTQVGTAAEVAEAGRKSSVIGKMAQPGVIFMHRGSKRLWEVIEIRKNKEDRPYAVIKSLQSGYRKSMFFTSYSYDNYCLHHAPDAVKVLFGDENFGNDKLKEQLKDVEILDTGMEELDED